ncbi:unnamed protein product (macronuclear) [Paramecium tetraurelia]|uniref:EF-hand domain-containing protein n=1 Tax=Paramecium tetraurelia TaxID=5888 RepID=A0D7C4_PARTE|nr:uncharacterized protein GSPATT00001983001 [Paramecium tetraurelia]CAK78941.1 unnamed protein product [Paramecium tetraurelia]|eukprot:XP_001446338.1 hypothetical protein (macronuclear) [Paramecium tetraurelia strain d4-2]
MQAQTLPNITTKSPQSKLKTLDSMLNAQIKIRQPKDIAFKTLPNNKTNISFLRNEKFQTRQDQYYSSPLLTKSQITEVEAQNRQSRNDFYSQMLSDNPYKYNEYSEIDQEYNRNINVNLLDMRNKDKIKEFLQESASFSNHLSTHTQRLKKVNVLTQRQDVIKLAQWLDYQMQQVVSNKKMMKQQQLREIEKIFNLSLKELVREISLDCVEKSVLLEKIWNQYVNYNTFLLKSLDDEKNNQENEYLQQLKSLHQTYQNSVKFLEDKLKQIDDEFNSLSTKFERKKFKLKNIKDNFFSIQEQKKEIEQEVEYLKNQRRDLLEIKEALQNQVENLTQENERLQTAIYQKSQELRTAKTKRYSQISIDSCFSEQNHKGTTMEDFSEMMSIKKEKYTQTFDHDKIKISTANQTDIKFIFHQGTQTGLHNEDDYYQPHVSENNDQMKRLLDQKYDLEEKLKLSNNIISELQRAKQHLMREQEINSHKLSSQEISLSALQKEIERLQSELQSLLQSRQQKKRIIVSLEENNGEQMSLGPVREQQRTPQNTLEKLVDKNNLNNTQKSKQQNQLQYQDNTVKNGKNDKAERTQGQNSNFTSNNASQTNSQNQTPLNKELSNNTASKLQTSNSNNQQQQGKATLHQKKPSDNSKSTSHNVNSNQKQTKVQNNKKPNGEQINNQSSGQQNNQINQGVQKLRYDTNQIGQVESSNKEQDQLNSSQIRNTLLNLNEVNNDDDQFGENQIDQNNQNEQVFKRSSTKKLSYKFNSSQPNSQNNSIYVNQLQRKGSYLTPPAPETKTIRDKEQQLKETALEFIKQFVQTINLQHPENIEQTMQLQNVFKLITQFYKERLERKQPIYVICYEFYMNTFGLKQIAENKLTMLCQAVIFYRSIPRVRLFSRFLQIQDPINDEDLDFYFSTLQHLDVQQKSENLISCTQNYEGVLILYDKALDQLASLDEHLMEIQQKFKSQIQILNGNRHIDLDLFFMESLQQFQLMKKIHQDNFKELFQAVDINDDDTISVEEFTILFNLIEEGQKDQQMFIQKFIETCGNSDGLSFYQFGMYCMSNQLFQKDKQDAFLQYNNEQFKILQTKWNEQRKQLTQRLKENLVFTEYYQNLVRKLDDSLKNNHPYSWLLWRILEEQCKRLTAQSK